MMEISFCLVGLDDESFPAHAVDTFPFHVLFHHAGLERLVIFLLLLAKQFCLVFQVFVVTTVAGCALLCYRTGHGLAADLTKYLDRLRQSIGHLHHP